MFIEAQCSSNRKLTHLDNTLELVVKGKKDQMCRIPTNLLSQEGLRPVRIVFTPGTESSTSESPDLHLSLGTKLHSTARIISASPRMRVAALHPWASADSVWLQ